MTWYSGDAVFDTVLAIGFGFTVFSFLGSLFVPAPYGRFPSEKMGVNLSPKLGWWLMELPAMLVFLWFYVQGPRALEAMPLLLALVWVIHYGNRGWFFPLSMRVVPGKKSSFSVSVMIGGMLVTAIHGYLNARWFGELGGHLTNAWFTDPRFLLGFAVYYTGFYITVRSEYIMRHLRDPAPGAAADGGYKIPYGGAFKWVTNPQYFGELVAWAGFTIMTWGLPGLMIFLISASNLVPRAFATHRWYRERFPDYPPERKVLIPGLL